MTQLFLAQGLQDIEFTTCDNTYVGCLHRDKIDAVLFQLPCQHIVCRQCLTSTVEKTHCLYCQTNFARKDVVRVYSRRTLAVDTASGK